MATKSPGWDVNRLLTREGLEDALGRPISSIACDATKPLEQSDITVLTLVWSGEDAKEVKVILKHVDVQSQRARISKSDEKWRISLRSFANEYLFYSKVDLNQVRFARSPRNDPPADVPHCFSLFNVTVELGRCQGSPSSLSTPSEIIRDGHICTDVDYDRYLLRA
jgi:hypothetical protein